MTPMGPDCGTGLEKGGFAFNGLWGVSVAANIAPAATAAHGDAELSAMITKGQHPDGHPMKPPTPFPYLAKMTDTDLSADITDLRQIPALGN
jgi:hypothetical protein